jgi:hypothetical protein
LQSNGKKLTDKGEIKMSRAKVVIAAVRAVGGIMGKGGKNVNPVYNTPVTPSVVIKPQGPKGAVQTGRDLDKLKKQNFKPSAKYKEEYTNAMNRSR